MSELILSEPEGPTTPLQAIFARDLDAWLADRSPLVRALAETGKFTAKPGQVLLLPGEDGGIARALVGFPQDQISDLTTLRAVPARLPSGDYVYEDLPDGIDATGLAVTWAMGAYRFDRYKQKREPAPRLVAPETADIEQARARAHAAALARDMINTPANDMGPLQMETIGREIAELFGAEITVLTGDGLIEANYPAVHAVGRAAEPYRAPRFIEMTWGDEGKPGLVLVGKGVVFDTGGLDIKPSAGMRSMKKDMGGAALVLALGRMVMAAKLPVRLSILVPVVENAISGDAMRPGDILASRKGLTIEVGNTDAEGRLILADALARAGELNPDLTIDMATLTGAARVALGPQVTPFYTADDDLADALASAARKLGDPLWRMPLWAGYDEAVDCEIADVRNDPDAWAQAGSITAALFLQRFAPTIGSWVHFDVFAWCAKPRPGYAAGGEAQAIHALFDVIRSRYV